jgi:hypothetical protein
MTEVDVGERDASNPSQAGDRMSLEGSPMGASVHGCGHASQLFKMDYFERSPQVHMHYLTDDDEYVREGFGRIEFVCHGCGCSKLVYYDDSKSKKSHVSVRNSFWKKHAQCKNRNYENTCPDYRRTIEVVDMRALARLVRPRARAA